MKQYDAINTITEVIINDGLVEACFLKGSIAEKVEDRYSDVDLYFVVQEDKRAAFLKKRLEYLRSYDEILYVSEVHFVCPQLVCVYENGLHLDLYTTTISEIVETGEIMVIYDPNHVLDRVQSKPLKLEDRELGNLVNEFSFVLMEYYTSYVRQDALFSFKLACSLYAIYVQVLRFFEQPDRSKIPAKGFWKQLSKEQQKDLAELTKHLRFESSLLAVKTLIIALNDLIINLPITIAQAVNYDFFLYTKTIVNGLNGEKL